MSKIGHTVPEPTATGDSSELQRARDVGAFARRLHARRGLSMPELAKHIVAARPPKRYHTARLLNQDGPTETVFAHLDLTEGQAASIEVTPPFDDAVRMLNWRSVGEWPTIRPGVIDLYMSISRG